MHFCVQFLPENDKAVPKVHFGRRGKRPKSALRAFQNALLEHFGDSFGTL